MDRGACCKVRGIYGPEQNLKWRRQLLRFMLKWRIIDQSALQFSTFRPTISTGSKRSVVCRCDSGLFQLQPAVSTSGSGNALTDKFVRLYTLSATYVATLMVATRCRPTRWPLRVWTAKVRHEARCSTSVPSWERSVRSRTTNRQGRFEQPSAATAWWLPLRCSAVETAVLMVVMVPHMATVSMRRSKCGDRIMESDFQRQTINISWKIVKKCYWAYKVVDKHMSTHNHRYCRQ